MAVLEMERIQVCAMKRDRKKILEMVQRRGVLEVSDAGEQDAVFTKTNTDNVQKLLSKNIQTADEALLILKKYVQSKEPMLGFLHGRKAISVDQYDDFYKTQETTLRIAQRVLQAEREMAEQKAEVLRVEALSEALEPWMNLPVPQTFKGTKKNSVIIGSLEGDVPLEEVLLKIAEAAPTLSPLHVEILHRSTTITAMMVMVLKRDKANAEEALRAIGFSRPASPSRREPAKQREHLEKQRQTAQDKIKELRTEVESYADAAEEIKFLRDHMHMRLEKYGVIELLNQSKHVFVLQGYVAAEKSQSLKDELSETFTCAVEVQAVEPEDTPPVLLKNNGFAKPMEPILESYSLPGKGEIDPCSAMSIFYYALFGLMFSDFGYGLIMVLACGFALLKFKNMEENWRKSVTLFFGCGVATMFWGVVFSSYFGDIVDAVARQFFGRAADAPTLMPPLWFSPLEKPMSLLMFCLLLGIIHLTAGYVMKAINCIRNKQYLDILYDAIFPSVVIYPLIVLLMGSDMFDSMAGFKLSLPAIATPICLAITGICLLGILFTGGRESKNWGKRILKGIYACYNALSGWLSDVLSYSRLLALGLATGVIGSVVNQMGGMFGGGVGGLIGLIVVFCLGHALNFGINVLGAYVHSNRLEYVEFFGKFYEGGGRKFKPFGIHTEYFKVEEEAKDGLN